MLRRALRSVLAQTLQPSEIAIVIDHDRQGATATRNRAWRMTTAEWVAFLDDDDEFGPDHLRLCWECAVATDADLVFPWFTVGSGGTDPFPETFGQTWDPAHPRQTTVTCLWRRSALEKIDGFPILVGDGLDDGGHRRGEDMRAVEALNAAGGRIVHLPERTWTWHHHDQNTSGIPARW